MAAGAELHLRHVGHNDLGSGALEIGARVEPLQQALAIWNFSAISASGDVYERPGSLAIASSSVGITLVTVRRLRLGDRVGLQDRRRPVDASSFQVSASRSGDRQPVDLLKGADGHAEVVSVKTVDRAGREMSPIEQRLALAISDGSLSFAPFGAAASIEAAVTGGTALDGPGGRRRQRATRLRTAANSERGFETWACPQLGIRKSGKA